MRNKDNNLYTCYSCARFEELSEKLLHGEKPPKECKRCAWREQEQELPLSKRPNFLYINF